MGRDLYNNHYHDEYKELYARGTRETYIKYINNKFYNLKTGKEIEELKDFKLHFQAENVINQKQIKLGNKDNNNTFFNIKNVYSEIKDKDDKSYSWYYINKYFPSNRISTKDEGYLEEEKDNKLKLKHSSFTTYFKAIDDKEYTIVEMCTNDELLKEYVSTDRK